MSVTKKPQPDSQPWKVSYTTPPTIKVKDEVFTSYVEANQAAKKYTRETGLHAAGVRA